MNLLYGIGFVAALLIALLMTPLVRRFAFWAKAVDAPNHRKVHSRIMPRLGGLAIFIAFIGAYFIVSPAIDTLKTDVVFGLLVGGTIVVLVGALDDRFDLSPKIKLLGQVLAASVVVYSGVTIDLVNVPFGDGTVSLSWLAVPLTIFWIVGVTNAINLIDGLDGLSAGVSAIATSTILVLALMMGNVTVVLLCTALLGSIAGFLFYNFHPAKIFMGDSGALFLGFTLATLSVLGFKQATVVSLLVPIMILGVPLSDTFFAIMRRWVNNLPISVADKSHLHHCLLRMGFSHRTTVLIIYGIASIFGFSAVLLSYMSEQQALWGAVILVAVLLVILVVGAEFIGIISRTKRPVLQFLNKIRMKTMQRMTK
ncbi:MULTISPECIES: glycosyltransferase family 4 protein [Paenibacillus]|uniref:glycosyltransferase family 4 protein n=1 Tax=Paenibacillus TaxID=44249 RepID=UPI0022B910F6|nr:MraY family glycosyltransferase [Paenibacillus caseinilyticus]MCZ8523328.1 MraY family glycosyltransferase [Paenibacillus caseinilyticus]